MRRARARKTIVGAGLAACALAGLAACGFLRPRAARAAEDPPEPSLEQLVQGPRAVRRVAPEYPDSLVQAGIFGTVTLDVLVTRIGAVGDVKVKAGPSALVPYAIAAVRQWQFTPDRSSGEPADSWVTIPVEFDPKKHATTVTAWPEPLVRVPLVTPTDGIDPSGPPFVGVLRFDIGADGFVQAASFVGPPPPGAEAILARARRWFWTPARDAHGKAIATWTSLRVSSAAGALEIARPDSSLGQVLGAANYANVKIVDRAGKGEARDMDPLALAHVFAGWLSEPRAYAGADPWRTRCPLRFDAWIEFDGPSGTLRADLARGCAWMQVTTRDRVLFVPYGAIRDRIETAFARLFPDSGAVLAPAPAPAAER